MNDHTRDHTADTGPTTHPDRPEGEIELTTRQRIGARVNVLAGLAVGAGITVSAMSIPTISSAR